MNWTKACINPAHIFILGSQPSTQYLWVLLTSSHLILTKVNFSTTFSNGADTLVEWLVHSLETWEGKTREHSLTPGPSLPRCASLLGHISSDASVTPCKRFVSSRNSGRESLGKCRCVASGLDSWSFCFLLSLTPHNPSNRKHFWWLVHHLLSCVISF